MRPFSRRLSALQSALGGKLVRRLPDKTLVLTDFGGDVAQKAEAMEREYCAIQACGSSCRAVRITSVPILINRLFARALNIINSDLRIELIPDARNLDLANCEADLAVRLARPVGGGLRVKARRISQLAYAAYAASELPEREARRLPWIGYHQTMSHLVQARWIEEVAHIDRNLAPISVYDAETALESAAAGFGRTLLPVIVGNLDPRLRRLDRHTECDYPTREV